MKNSNYLNSYKYKCDVKTFKTDIFKPLEKYQNNEKLENKIETDYTSFKHKFMSE